MKVNVGDIFTATISDIPVEGKIQIENNIVYLCQDRRSGDSCDNKLGYKYSWNVGCVILLSNVTLGSFNVFDFVLIAVFNFIFWYY